MMNSNSPARCAVVGNPIAHSRSPQIHHSFAQALGITLNYERMLSTEQAFAQVVQDFFTGGGKGLNITVPFKLLAHEMAQVRTQRCELAQAANTLWMHDGALHADNTDGAGLVNDLLQHQGMQLRGARVLMLGAGGATQGVLLPLMQTGVTQLVIANRTADKAHALVKRMHAAALAAGCQLHSCSLDELSQMVAGGFDLVVNATAAGLHGEHVQLPEGVFTARGLGYDMAYGAAAAQLLEHYQAQGAQQVADGLGMLVGQAAQSFAIWHGITPPIELIKQVMGQLR